MGDLPSLALTPQNGLFSFFFYFFAGPFFSLCNDLCPWPAWATHVFQLDVSLNSNSLKTYIPRCVRGKTTFRSDSVGALTEEVVG